jgi:hypothetical protein
MACERADGSFVYLPGGEKNAEAFQKETYKAYLNPLHLHITGPEKYHKAVDEHMKAFGEINTLVTNSACMRPANIFIGPAVLETTFLVHFLGMNAMSISALKNT